MVAERHGRFFAEKAGLTLDEASVAALDATLARLLDAARAAWPKIGIAPADFVAHLARHARSTPAPLAFLEAVHASDLYLACAAALHDRAALTAFEEHFMVHVPEYVLRVRIGREAVDEVKQTMRERLLMGDGDPKIAEYSGKGALGGWLRVTAVRTALNQLRGSGPNAASETLREDLAVAGDPELAYVKEHAHDLLNDAFKRVLSGLDANERAILRLHYFEGLTMDQLARLYQTPRSTIARRVAEARTAILAATENLLRDERRMSPSAIASVIREARSRLEVTISRLLE